MANTSLKISTLVSKQLPEFVREDNPLFVEFLEAYFEYLEQSDSSKVIDQVTKFKDNMDVDTTVDAFAQKMYNEFLKFFPNNTLADKALIMKRAKDFYRSRGTEKSYKFLFRAIFGKEAEIYRPKDDILIASSGRWFIEQSLRVTATTVNGISDTTLDGFQKFVNTKIVGQTSGVSAFVERVLIAYENSLLKYELFISNATGSFTNGETLNATNVDGDVLSAIIISGILASITLTNTGSLYNVGDPLVFSGGFGTGAAAFISSVSTGSIVAITTVDGGAGFKLGDLIQFSGGGGTGANGNVATILGTANSFFHPNTYNLVYDTILLYANVQLNVANYAFPAYANANINTAMNSAFSTFTFGPVGPIGTVLITNQGSGYTSAPVADPIGNVWIKSIGVLGKMRVVTPGHGYANGDIIQFVNGPGSFGSGANATVYSVNANGAIEHVIFQPVSGWVTGGVGYDIQNLPTCNVVSAAGVGANVIVTTLLGFGSPGTTLSTTSGTVGEILSISITNRGAGYNTTPTISLAGSGDGTANAYANIVTGIFSYPGRYLDDTGFLSSFNFLQDRDYYQNYSYVIKVRESLNIYRQIVKDLLHPVGTKMFGQYMLGGDTFSNTHIVVKTSNVSLTPTS